MADVLSSATNASNYSFTDSAKEVDKLYAADPANVIMPICDIWSLASQLLNGASLADIMSRLAVMRRVYKQHEP